MTIVFDEQPQDQVFSAQEKRQLIGRIWRYPQKHVCIMYELILNNTCDSVLYEISQGKALMMETFIDNGSPSAAMIQSIFHQADIAEPIDIPACVESAFAIGAGKIGLPAKNTHLISQPLSWAQYLKGLPEYLAHVRAEDAALMKDSGFAARNQVVGSTSARAEISWEAYFKGLKEFLAECRALDRPMPVSINAVQRTASAAHITALPSTIDMPGIVTTRSRDQTPTSPAWQTSDCTPVDEDLKGFEEPEVPLVAMPVHHQSQAGPSNHYIWDDQLPAGIQADDLLPKTYDWDMEKVAPSSTAVPTHSPSTTTYRWEADGSSSKPAAASSSLAMPGPEDSRKGRLWYDAGSYHPITNGRSRGSARPLLLPALSKVQAQPRPTELPLGGMLAARRAVYQNLTRARLTQNRTAMNAPVRPPPSNPLERPRLQAHDFYSRK
jgi:hypothetical protein